MRRSLAWGCCAALLMFCFACSKADQEREHQRAEEAKAKTRQEARKLRDEAKQQARNLRQNINRALQDGPPAQGGTGNGAGDKLRRGGEDLRAAGGQASVKLSHAAMIAKVKAKLATDVGLSTVTGVDVDASGQVVTLRGTVASEDEKQRAEQAVRQVSGVTRVINDLTVR